MNKIVSIVGARPQFIKAALVCRQLRDKGFQEILVHTGQHYDLNMSDIFFDELNIPKPDYHLGVGSGPQGRQTGNMLIEIEQILTKECPDLVLVYGDTNSTLAGSLAASKLHIPIAHVEAGLRSYNKEMPEEINRVLTDHMSFILFCPTDVAVENLSKEGFEHAANQGKLIGRDHDAATTDTLKTCQEFKKPLVINVGDVMYDVAMTTQDIVNAEEVLGRYGLESKKYVLATIHRAENTDNLENLKVIRESLLSIAKQGITIVFPLHPRTRKVFEEKGMMPGLASDYVRITEPVSYAEMIALESNACSIITDSGGVQKEGYFFKVPCVIPRNETEWVELVESGWNVVTGINEDKIVDTTIRLSRISPEHPWSQYYGDGYAVNRIVNVLKDLE